MHLIAAVAPGSGAPDAKCQGVLFTLVPNMKRHLWVVSASCVRLPCEEERGGFGGTSAAEGNALIPICMVKFL